MFGVQNKAKETIGNNLSSIKEVNQYGRFSYNNKKSKYEDCNYADVNKKYSIRNEKPSQKM
jgi:hypothetical protein